MYVVRRSKTDTVAMFWQNVDDLGTGHYQGPTRGNYGFKSYSSEVPKMVCKGNCKQFEAHSNKGGRYINRQVRCQTCTIFLDIDKMLLDKDNIINGTGDIPAFPTWNIAKCPCCHLKIRNRPRMTKMRKKLQGVKEE